MRAVKLGLSDYPRSQSAGLGRESLYKALSPTGTPAFGTILKVIAALGLKLHPSPAPAKSPG